MIARIILRKDDLSFFELRNTSRCPGGRKKFLNIEGNPFLGFFGHGVGFLTDLVTNNSGGKWPSWPDAVQSTGTGGRFSGLPYGSFGPALPTTPDVRTRLRLSSLVL